MPIACQIGVLEAHSQAVCAPESLGMSFWDVKFIQDYSFYIKAFYTIVQNAKCTCILITVTNHSLHFMGNYCMSHVVLISLYDP